jgi:hypothetical protein
MIKKSQRPARLQRIKVTNRVPENSTRLVIIPRRVSPQSSRLSLSPDIVPEAMEKRYNPARALSIAASHSTRIPQWIGPVS